MGHCIRTSAVCALLASFGGCIFANPDADLPPDARIRCSSDAECPSTHACVIDRGECALRATGQLEVLELTVVPPVGRQGTVFAVDFALSDAILEGTVPVAVVDTGARLAPLTNDAAASADGRFVFTYESDGSEAAGSRPVTVSATRPDATLVEGLAAGVLTFDFAAPLLAEPPTWSSPFVTLGSGSILTFNLNEVASATTLVLEGADGERHELALAPDLTAGEVTLEADVDGDGQPDDGRWQASLSVVDEAGNAAILPAGEIVVDTLPPTVLSSELTGALLGPGRALGVLLTLSEPVLEASSAIAVSTAGTLPLERQGSGSTLSFVTLTAAGDDGTYQIEVSGLVDAAGNAGEDGSFGPVVVDTLAPGLASFTLEPDQSSFGPADTVVVTLVADEPLAETSPPTLALLAPTGPVAFTPGGEPGVFSLPLAGLGLVGTFRIQATLTDPAENVSLTDVTLIDIDAAAPGVLDVSLTPASAGAGDVVILDLTFDEVMAPLAPEDLSFLDEGTGASLTGAEMGFAFAAAPGTRVLFTAVVDGTTPEGSFLLTEVAGFDVAGNPLGALPAGDHRFAVDRTPPALVSMPPIAVVTRSVPGYLNLADRDDPTDADLSVTFTLSEPVSPALVTLSFGPDDAACVPDDAGDPRAFTCTLSLAANAAEGPRDLLLALTDDAGNPMAAAGDRVTLDFTPPGLAAFSVVYAPSPENPLGAVAAARFDTEVTLVAIADEPLDEAVVPSVSAGPVSFEPGVVDGLAVTFARTPGPIVAGDGDYTASVSWRDLAGNDATVSDDARPIRVKTSTPVLTVAQDQVTFWRSPLGNDAPETIGAFTIPAGPYFALAPGDPLSGEAALLADTFVLDSGPPLRVRVFADPGLTSLMSTRAPSADGSWPRAPALASLDTQALYVTGVDEAGNESDPVAIARSEWVATSRPAGFGVSPHAIDASTRTTPARTPDAAAAVSTGTSELAGADETALVVAGAGLWRERVPQGRPEPRTQFSLAFDSARGRVVLFGGENSDLNDFYDDVWEWDGERWHGPLRPAQRPGARSNAGLAYDSRRGRSVLFGGSGAEFFDDVWEWDGTSWRGPYRPQPRPAARDQHAMAFDSARGRAVVFGGRDDSLDERDDVWEWDGTSWAGPFTPMVHPSARVGPKAAFDSLRDRVVVFGGQDAGGLSIETWEWTGTDWIGPTAAPLGMPGRRGHAMAYDRSRMRTVLYGGNGAAFRNVWEWDGATWTGPLAAFTGPGAVRSHDLAYDAVRERIVLFGGNDIGNDSDELWEWDGTSWSGPVAPSPVGPSARLDPGVAYDSARQRVVLFGGGGLGAAPPLDDVWEWDGRAWYGPFTPATRPPARRARHAMAYDAARGRVVLVGGDSGIALEDVWEWDGAAWYGPFGVGTGPGPRARHTTVYDPENELVLLFGGDGGGSSYDDVWEWNGTDWNGPIAPAPRPSARSFHSAAYDAGNGRMVVVGGQNATTPGDPPPVDVWEWDGAAWNGPFLPAVQPTNHGGHSLAYDEGLGRLVLYGNDNPSKPDDLWEWTGSEWIELLVAGGPAQRSGHALAFDAARDALFVFGGITTVATTLEADTWVLERSPDRRPAVQLSASFAGALGLPAVTGLHVRARCGGAFDPFDASSVGATLLGWSGGGVALAPGAWEVLDGNGVGPSGPFAASGLEYEATTADEARRFLLSGPSLASFRCEAGGPSGVGEATLAADYLEVRIGYSSP